MGHQRIRVLQCNFAALFCIYCRYTVAKTLKFKKNGKRENNFNIVLGLDLYLLTVLEYSTGGDFIDKQ